MVPLPDIPRDGNQLPERGLTPEQFEIVIRRAAELQARGADEHGADAISAAEVMRIGREIGISPQHLQQALAEASTGSTGRASITERLFGAGWVSASRTVTGEPDAVREHLDRYLLQREWLAVLRRFRERAVYQKGRGLDLARVIDLAQTAILPGRKEPEVGAGFKLRNARRVEVAVQALEDGLSHVTIGVDLRNYRAGFATAGFVGGTSAAGAIAATLAIAVDPAAGILGLPVLGGSLWGFRAAQNHTVEHARTHLEALLDCLERGEPLVRSRGDARVGSEGTMGRNG